MNIILVLIVASGLNDTRCNVDAAESIESCVSLTGGLLKYVVAARLGKFIFTLSRLIDLARIPETN